MHTPVKTLNYRSEVPDSRRRSTSDDQVSFQSQSLLLVDLHYRHMQMSQMSDQTAALQCVSIVPDRPDLSFRLVLSHRVLRASATVSEKFVVLTRFLPSPVSRHRDLLSFGNIGLLPMGHGSYYLVSSQPNQWLPIDEDGRKLFGKVDVSDDKKRGIVLGLPSSNKYWKGAWFFVGGDWGRSLPADREKSLSEAYVPRLFTQPGIFVTGPSYLCFHCKENPVAADVDACDLEEEPLLRRSSAKGKGPVVEEEKGPPKLAGGDGVEVYVGAAGGSRGAIPTSSGVFALMGTAGSPEVMSARDRGALSLNFGMHTPVKTLNYRSKVPDSRRRSTSDDQVSFQSLLLVDLHYRRIQMSQMSFRESSGPARVSDRFREVCGAHEVLAVSGKPSLRPPFLWKHRIASNGTRTHIFSSGAMLAVGDDVALYGEILHTTFINPLKLLRCMLKIK
ncbi:hypothetical protein ACOSQ2_010124 [Xanthoceras sorbifolium]